jgi:hypothetical protein
MTKGTPATPTLRNRIQRALDHGLTQREFCNLISEGRVTATNVGRALRGDPLSLRTLRSLTRCAEAFEAQRGYGPEASPVAPAIAEAKPSPKTVEKPRPIPPVVGAALLLVTLEHLEDICGLWADPRWKHVLAPIMAAKAQLDR